MTLTNKINFCVFKSLVLKGSASELALIDTQPDKLKGEMMDLQHSQAFLKTTKVLASTGILFLVDELNNYKTF